MSEDKKEQTQADTVTFVNPFTVLKTNEVGAWLAASVIGFLLALLVGQLIPDDTNVFVLILLGWIIGGIIGLVVRLSSPDRGKKAQLVAIIASIFSAHVAIGIGSYGSDFGDALGSGLMLLNPLNLAGYYVIVAGTALVVAAWGPRVNK